MATAACQGGQRLPVALFASGSPYSFDIRRGRIDLQGTIHRWFTFRVQPELAGKPYLHNGWVDIGPRPWLHLRAGQMKVPFSSSWATGAGGRSRQPGSQKALPPFGKPHGFPHIDPLLTSRRTRAGMNRERDAMQKEGPWRHPGNGRLHLPFGLKWRIVGLLVLASLAPLLLVGIGSWVVFGRLLLDRSLEQHRSVVQSHAAAIDLYLGERTRALELAARTHDMEQLAAPGRLQHLFDEISAAYPRAFVDLGLIDRRGRHVAYVGPYDLKEKNYARAAWFRTVASQGSFVSDVFLGHRRVPHVVIAVLRREAGSFWVLRATINSDSFCSLVRPGQLGRTGDAFIVNADGRYQTPPKLGQVLEQSSIRPRLHRNVQDRLVTGDRGSMVQVTTWLNDNRWLLVVHQDEAEIRAPVHQATAWGALVVSIAVAVVVLVIILATAHLTGRIDRATSERDQVYRDLVRSGKLASLGELSTGLAHEINNPLAIISAEQTNIADQVEDLQISDEARKDLNDSVARCKRQVERCSGITSKMLKFGRKAESRPRPTSIVPMLGEIVELMRRQARVRNVELEIEVAQLPEVVVDGIELEQVLVNLIKNGIEAIDGSGKIVVSGRQVGEEVQVAVADSGSGIAPENLDRVFQPFFTTKPVGQGTGMGLAMCYGIVRSWGGTIEARSEEGKGTTMTLHLRLEKTSG